MRLHAPRTFPWCTRVCISCEQTPDHDWLHRKKELHKQDTDNRLIIFQCNRLLQFYAIALIHLSRTFFIILSANYWIFYPCLCNQLTTLIPSVSPKVIFFFLSFSTTFSSLRKFQNFLFSLQYKIKLFINQKRESDLKLNTLQKVNLKKDDICLLLNLIYSNDFCLVDKKLE